LLNQIPNHLIVQIATTADRLLLETGIQQRNPNLYSLVSTNINPNVPNAGYLQPLVMGVLQMIPNWQLLMQQGGISQDVFRSAVHNALGVIVQNASQHLAASQPMQGMQMAMRPNMPMGSLGMGGGMGMPGAGGVSYGDSAVYRAPAPQQAATPIFETMFQKQAQEEKKVVQSESVTHNLMFRPAVTADIGEFADKSVEVLSYKTADTDERRYSISVFNLLRAENDPTAAFLSTVEGMPDGYLRGTWMHLIRYNRLVHVDMPTNEFINCVTPMAVAYDKGGWQAALAATKEFNRGAWSVISDLITEAFNQGLARRMRLGHIDGVIHVDDIDDIITLYKNSSVSGMGDHPNYTTVLEQIADRAVRLACTLGSVIKGDDEHFGDFVKCKHVRHFRDGYSEYDYGSLKEAADRKAFIGEMLAAHTVLRIPSFVVATTSLPSEVVGEVDGDAHTYPVFLGGTNSVFGHMLKNIEYPEMALRSLYQDLDAMMLAYKLDGELQAEPVQIGSTLDGETILVHA